MVTIAVLLAVLGVILGSFVNALVWRLYKQSIGPERAEVGKKPKTKNQKPLKPAELSILKGRSMCPDCHHTLAAKDLVPVFSWLYLRGKCRYCHKPISWQYPVVELVTALVFVVSYAVWPYGFHGFGLFQFVLWLGFLVGFMALAVYDLRWMVLPDRIIVPLTLLAGLQTLVGAVWGHSLPNLYNPLLGAIIVFGLFWGLFQLSKGRWIGGGDVKLAVTLGLLAGTPAKAFLVIFFASLLGTIASLPMIVSGKRGLASRIPFGPYLLLATVIVVLWGGQMVHWYQGLLLSQ